MAGILGFLTDNYYNNKATSALNKATQQGIDTINQYYNEGKGYLDPYNNTGIIANTGINKLLQGDYSGFYNSPDFKAAMQAGGDMLDNSAASRGGLFGGGQQRALTNYGQQLASQYLGNYRNWLGGVSGAGQNAASNIGQLGQAAGQNLATLYGDMGRNNAANQQARGSGIGGLIGDIAGSLFGGLF